MIIVMQSQATDADIEHVISRIEELGLKAHLAKGIERTVIGVIGDERLIKKDQFSLLPRVENVIPILKPYKLASRDFKEADSVVDVAGVKIGGKRIAVIAGAASFRGESTVVAAARARKASRGALARGA